MAPKNMKDEVQLYRKIIARYAAAFVSENDTIFINTSSNADVGRRQQGPAGGTVS